MTKSLSIISILFLLYSCSDGTENKSTKNAAETIVTSNKTITSAFGNGRIESEFKVIKLASSSTGILTKVLKNENESVKKGDVLAELEKSAEDGEVQKVLAQIKKFRTQNEINSVEIREGEQRLFNSSRELQRSKALVDLGAETKQDYDDASLNYELEQSKLDKASTNRIITNSEIEALYAELKIAKALRNRKNITAPTDGKVLEWQISHGEGTQISTTVAQFAPEGKLIAVCEIDELLADKLQIGQKAIIRAQDRKNTIGEGQVYFLSDFLNSKSIFGDSSSEAIDRRVRTVKISFDKQPNLLINSRIQCEIILNSINP